MTWSDAPTSFAAHQHVLLAPLMVKMASRHDRLHLPLVLLDGIPEALL
ncbi:hypothetical protein [Nonomuraea dietziae]